MASFRETLWFKAGHFDVDDEEAHARLEATPLDVRYAAEDDSIALGDSLRFGVHTGVTQPIPRAPAADDPAATAAIAKELTRVRGAFVAALGATVVAAALFVFLM